MAPKQKSQHFSTRVSALTYAKLDLMKDLQGMESISDLVRKYVEQGLKLDSVDIEQKVEERLAAERKRLQAVVASMGSVEEEGDDEDEDEDEGPDMFTETDDEASLVMAPANANGAAPANHDDLVPD